MSETQTSTLETSDARSGASDAEKLAALEAENEGLRRQVEQLMAMTEDRATRDARLAAAEAENARLQGQATEAVVSEALAKAAENLDIEPATVLSMYRHHFQAVPTGGGAYRVEPNPTEFLLQRMRSDAFLEASRRRQQEEHAGDMAIDNPGGDAAKVLAALDRSPSAKADWIQKHGQETFHQLVRNAEVGGYKRQGGR